MVRVHHAHPTTSLFHQLYTPNLLYIRCKHASIVLTGITVLISATIGTRARGVITILALIERERVCVCVCVCVLLLNYY